MIGNEQQGNLDDWDNFLGSNFLKAKDVDPEDIFVVVGLEYDGENDRPILLLENTGKKSKFSLNVTNSNYLKNNGIKSPKECVGKKITFNQEPTSKGLGLRIKSIN
jgi:hypothetical protein